MQCWDLSDFKSDSYNRRTNSLSTLGCDMPDPAVEERLNGQDDGRQGVSMWLLGIYLGLAWHESLSVTQRVSLILRFTGCAVRTLAYGLQALQEGFVAE